MLQTPTPSAWPCAGEDGKEWFTVDHEQNSQEMEFQTPSAPTVLTILQQPSGGQLPGQVSDELREKGVTFDMVVTNYLDFLI